MKPQHLLLDGALGAGLLLALGVVFALDRPTPAGLVEKEVVAAPVTTPPRPRPQAEPMAPGAPPKAPEPPPLVKTEEKKPEPKQEDTPQVVPPPQVTPAPPPQVTLSELEETIRKKGRLKLAVSRPSYDDMGKLLAALGKGYEYTQLEDRELEDPARLKQFDVLFLTCQGGGITSRLKASLREFVSNGGTLYASDLRHTVVCMAFPEMATKQLLPAGNAGEVTATVLDPGLRDVLGKTVKLKFDAGGWRPALFKPGRTVTRYLRGTYRVGAGKTATASLLVKFPFSKGNVIFTSFHNAKINSETAEKLLRFLVFSAVTAEESRRITLTMMKGGFAPQKETLSSASEGAAEVTNLYDNKKAGPLKFALGFKTAGARLRLTVTSPSGEKKVMEGDGTFVIDVPDAARGDWTYTVTALRVPYANFPFTVTIGEIVPKR